MTDSLRLLLEDFLGLMREEGELDVFLPLLMSAMGHEIVYRAQKGPRQYGVDIASVGPDVDGHNKLFLWLVKCGDITRSEWNSGPQSVRQSIDDVGDVYLRSHVAPEHKALKKKLLVITNGDFVASLNETIAGFLETWSERAKAEVEQVNGSKLAAWTEKHLLDEYILPTSNRALLRRMLANVGTPELCVSVGRQLIDEMINGALAPAKSDGAQVKRLLTGLRGLRTALRVLQVWAANEENLLAPYLLSQYAVLAAWSRLHGKMSARDARASCEFSELLLQLATAAEAYHVRMDDYYLVQDGFANALPDSVLVSRTIFDELGRLGQQGCFWAMHAAIGQRDDLENLALSYAGRARALIQSHTCSGLPTFDYQSTNIHVALLLLVVTGQSDFAQLWIKTMCQRFHYATGARQYFPMSAPLEEAILVRQGFQDMDEDSCTISTLLPLLLIWTGVLGMPESYAFLREQVLPRMKGTTPNVWSSEAGFDSAVGGEAAVHAHGVGEAISYFPEDPAEFLRMMEQGLGGIETIEASTWYQLRAPHIPLLAALYWRAQVPREMMVKQAMAFASSDGPTAMRASKMS